MNATNILESVSIIIAAWTVIISITAWRREYIGKRNLELAEEILCVILRIPRRDTRDQKPIWLYRRGFYT